MTLCTIDNIAFGGDGIARIEGLAIFIPFTLPGEKVEIEITQKKKNFAKASLLKILESSSERRTPPCPYFGKCGGCQLQHASYPLQLSLKKRFVEDSLTRIGNISYPTPSLTPSLKELGYRRHISLKLKLVEGQFLLGFTSVEGSHLPIYSCLLFNSEQDSILPALQDTFAKLDPLLTISESSIRMIKHSQNRYLITCNFPSPLPPREIEVLKKSFKSIPSITGWIIKTPKQLFELGETTPSFTHKNLTFHYSPFGFVQNHAEQSGKIYDWIVEKNLSSKKILDLYCGIGASSILLAEKGKEVIGVELNPLSIELAIQNAKQNQIEGIDFICASAETSTKKELDSFKPDTLVINPPKAGIDKEVLKEIVHSSCVSITYISCNPPTLARDLAFLIENGFVLKDLQAFDMFPQTTHVETAVHLMRI